jgi:hypothetical protein
MPSDPTVLIRRIPTHLPAMEPGEARAPMGRQDMMSMREAWLQWALQNPEGTATRQLMQVDVLPHEVLIYAQFVGTRTLAHIRQRRVDARALAAHLRRVQMPSMGDRGRWLMCMQRAHNDHGDGVLVRMVPTHYPGPLFHWALGIGGGYGMTYDEHHGTDAVDLVAGLEALDESSES